MSYEYKKRSSTELEDFAELILRKVPSRKRGLKVEIEGIVEDLGITILPRRGYLHELAFGYCPRDPKYIVVAEATAAHPPTYRTIVAEEVCHTILEFELWSLDELPEGSKGHNITKEQLKLIEEDATYLSCALLCPKCEFVSQFTQHRNDLEAAGGEGDKLIREIIVLLMEDFSVSKWAAARRAMHLELISAEDHKRNFSDRIAF